MFNKKDLNRDKWMLTGKFKKRGYDWWWHSFTGFDPITKEEVPFFVEFFTINPGLKEDKPILGQDINNKNKRPSYLMIKCGAWTKNYKVQLHRFISLKDVDIEFDKEKGYSIKADDCFASETKLIGHVKVTKEESKNPGYMCDSGEMSFDLSLEKKITFNVGYGAGKLFRFLKAFDMYWHIEGMKTEVEGKITLNGKEFLVKKDSSYGYSDKNWGCDFTTPWVWLASNDIYSEKEKRKLNNSAFDIGGGRPVAFHIPLNRKLLGVFYLEGNEKPEFNFSKFWMGVKTIFHKKENDNEVIWKVIQENHHYRMETDITCLKEDMLFVNYEDPKGNKRFKHLYNGGNGKGTIKLYFKKGKYYTLIDTYIVNHVGCEYGEYEN